MTSSILESVLALGLLVGCGSSESASGKTSGGTGDGGPAAGGNTVMSGSGGSIGGVGEPSSAGGTAGSLGTAGVGGGSNGGQSSGGAPNTGGTSSGGGTAGSGGASGDASCDPRKILCKRVAPDCGSMEVPSVEGSCYGPCVAIGNCACTAPEECPDSNQYTCNKSAGHCTPYLL